LDLLAKPEPNGKLLGLFRLKLWLYNIGIFKQSLGEPPVLLESVAPDRISTRMRTLLESKGYFLAEVRYTVHEEEKTADIQYDIAIHSPYRISGITVKGGNTALLDAIRSPWERQFLAAGDQFDLVKLKQERERIGRRAQRERLFLLLSRFHCISSG